MKLNNLINAKNITSMQTYTRSNIVNTIAIILMAAAFYLPVHSVQANASNGCHLELTKSVDKTTAAPGDVLTYTIHYKNIGTADCTGGGVRIQDTVNENQTFIAGSATQSGAITQGYHDVAVFYDAGTRKLTWNANEVAPGDSGTVTWKGKVNDSIACGTTEIPNTAYITSFEYAGDSLSTTSPSPWVSSNTVKTLATKTCSQPLQISCTVDKSNANVGDTVLYSAHVTGGNGTYAYAWTGTDNVTGTKDTTSKTYTTSGAKTATVTITSDGQSATASCGTTIAEQHVTLVGSCTPSASRVRVGEVVVWSATASGGNGTYSYNWNDAHSFFESAWTTHQSWSTPGTKTNTVTITSGDQSITKLCSVEVYQDTPDLVGSCTVDDDDLRVGDTATWRATASGGNGDYTYSWSGDNGLSSSNRTVTKNYNSSGEKDASVRITDSNGHSVVANCSLNVRDEVHNDLEVSCKANPSTADVGERVTWSATASGGNGGYSYDWSGDHGLTGTDRTESGTYDTSGTKHATVRVTSDDGQSETANCSMNVEDVAVTVYTSTDNTPTSQVYLSQVPYTGPMDNFKMALYILSFFLWSAGVSYYILRRKYGPNAMAMVTAQAGAMRDEFSLRLNSLRTLRVTKKSQEAVKAEAALNERQEMLKKLWDRSN